MADKIPEPIIIDVRGCDWQDVWTKVIEKLPDQFAGTPRFRDPPLSNVVEQLKRLDCSRLVVGYPFRDADYIYDYQHDIGSTFRDHGRHCIRLHFFSGDHQLEKATIIQDLHNLPRCPDEKTDPAAYLGFMVIRPTGKDCVGRTIIHQPIPGTTGPFIHVIARYECNFWGSRLAVSGAPFMQQDRSNHICAAAALWGMCFDLHRRYHTPRMFPRQITEIATAYDPKAEFEWGLSARHMSHVLRHIGCANDLFSVRLEGLDADEKDLVFREVIDVIYGYVQSNMPVLVGYWPNDRKRATGHAVLVVGHDFRETPVNPNKNAQGVWSSEYVDSWFCADDQRGVYEPLKVWAEDRQWGHGPMKENGVPVLQRARKLFVLPGLTRDARMTYRDAKRRIDEWFQEFKSAAEKARAQTQSLDASGSSWDDILSDLKMIETECRRRLYLQLSTRFRTQLLALKRGRTGLGGDIIEAYSRLPLPTHLYVCDFCDKKPKQDGTFGLHGEILLDATAPKFAHKDSILAVRIEDHMLFWKGDKWLSLTDEEYWDGSRPFHSAPSDRDEGPPL